MYTIYITYLYNVVYYLKIWSLYLFCLNSYEYLYFYLLLWCVCMNVYTYSHTHLVTHLCTSMWGSKIGKWNLQQFFILYIHVECFIQTQSSSILSWLASLLWKPITNFRALAFRSSTTIPLLFTKWVLSIWIQQFRLVSHRLYTPLI